MDQVELFALVLMPFDTKFDDVYKIAIKESAARVGIKAERIDEQMFAEGIIDRIYNQIETADIIVADMSERNANVFYEVGYAHAKNKLCILITNKAEDIPFDLKYRKHIVYGSSITYLREELAKTLDWAKTEIENVRQSHIRVVFNQPFGDLELTQYSASATINFRVDLFNDSNKSSPEITAIYVYFKHMWDVKQGDKTCPSTASDISSYKRRYFLTPPITRLHKNSWAQLQYSARRTLAYASGGKELEDEYGLRIEGILRFITVEGSFDYDFAFDVTVENLPF